MAATSGREIDNISNNIRENNIHKFILVYVLQNLKLVFDIIAYDFVIKLKNLKYAQL